MPLLGSLALFTLPCLEPASHGGLVAGRVKAAMGFLQSPVTLRPGSPLPFPAPLQLPGSAALGWGSRRCGDAAAMALRLAGVGAVRVGSKVGPFSRYFPRSSAQVQPACAASKSSELVRLIEELLERESASRGSRLSCWSTRSLWRPSEID